MVNRCRLHDRTGCRLFAMMPTTDVTIIPRTYFIVLSIGPTIVNQLLVLLFVY